jgi:predicted PurR-regulated permease PerM
MSDRVTSEDTQNRTFPKISPVEFVLAFGGVALFFSLLYATQTIFSPFVLLISLFVVLYPLRTNPVIRNILGFSALIFILWLAKTIEVVLAPFIIAFLLSYLLHPVVTRVERWSVPRWVTAFAIILFTIAVITLLLIVVVPMIVQQFGTIFQTFSSLSSQANNWMMNGDVFKTLRRFGVSNGQLREFLGGTVSPRMQDVAKAVLQGASGIMSEFNALLTGIVNIVIIPFLTFFMLKDFPLLKHRMKMIIPKAQREESLIYFQHVDEIIGRYLRGAMIIALFDAVTVSVTFSLIGIEYAMVIGMISGMLTFLPYFGFMTMLVITTIASALGQDQVLLHMLLGLGIVASLHVIETYVLGPKILGGKLGLHPVVLIFSLLFFGELFGFIGLVVAIPTASTIIAFAKEWGKKRRRERQEQPAEAPAQ